MVKYTFSADRLGLWLRIAIFGAALLFLIGKTILGLAFWPPDMVPHPMPPGSGPEKSKDPVFCTVD